MIIIISCVVAILLTIPFIFWAVRKKTWWPILALLTIIVAVIAFAFSSVCVQITDTVGIGPGLQNQIRAHGGTYGVWQEKNGQLYQCGRRLDRAMFF